MGKLIFILGGVRAGKSSFALELAQKSGKKVTFIATATPMDSDMRRRIKIHKNTRPKEWKTIEVKSNLDKKIRQEKNGVILMDCLTIYTSYLMDLPETQILDHIKKIIKAIKESESDVILVSNEVGCGLHPETKLGRDYRDVLGRTNQMFAEASDEFYVMFAGIPINIKQYGKNQPIRQAQG
ncbi:MAG: bifunctional adenosylcobinamide kinase/adenosylcobinamide-phosphate guanylyltransferase [Candidatus Doudnabacteria bacterium]